MAGASKENNKNMQSGQHPETTNNGNTDTLLLSEQPVDLYSLEQLLLRTPEDQISAVLGAVILKSHLFNNIYTMERFLKHLPPAIASICTRELLYDDAIFNSSIGSLVCLPDVSAELAEAIRQRIITRPQGCKALSRTIIAGIGENTTFSLLGGYITGTHAITFLENYLTYYFPKPARVVLDTRIYDFVSYALNHSPAEQQVALCRGILASDRIAPQIHMSSYQYPELISILAMLPNDLAHEFACLILKNNFDRHDVGFLREVNILESTVQYFAELSQLSAVLVNAYIEIQTRYPHIGHHLPNNNFLALSAYVTPESAVKLMRSFFLGSASLRNDEEYIGELFTLFVKSLIARFVLPEFSKFSEELFQDDKLGEMYIYQHDLLLEIASKFPAYTKALVASHEACMTRHGAQCDLVSAALCQNDYSAARMWLRAGSRLPHDIHPSAALLSDKLTFSSPASAQFVFELIQHGFDPDYLDRLTQLTCLEHFSSMAASQTVCMNVVELMCLGAGTYPRAPAQKKQGLFSREKPLIDDPRQAAMVPVMHILYRLMPSLLDYVRSCQVPESYVTDYSRVIYFCGKLDFQQQIAIRRPHHEARNTFLNLCLSVAIHQTSLGIPFDLLMLILRAIGLDKSVNECRALMETCVANRELLIGMIKTPGGINVSQRKNSAGASVFAFYKSAITLETDYRILTAKCKAADQAQNNQPNQPWQPSRNSLIALGTFRANHAERCRTSHLKVSGAAQTLILHRKLQDSDLYREVEFDKQPKP